MSAVPESLHRPLLLPEPEIPFPVEAVFAVRPDLRKLESGQPLLRYDDQAPRYLADKFARLRGLPQRCLAFDHASQAEWGGVLRAVMTRLSQAAPQWIVASADGWRLALPGLQVRPDWTVVPAVSVVDAQADVPSPHLLASWLAAQPPAARIAHAIGLAMQDDWVVMRAQPEPASALQEGSRAEWLHVCFPSGWTPADKVGRPLAQIHGPVADGDALRVASETLSRAMSSKGPFVRHVWTLASSAALARHPDEGLPQPPGSFDAIQFRCERQVTAPLAEPGRSLFLIRVYVAPLVQVAADSVRRATLVSALESMSDAVVRYKGIGTLREQVLQKWGHPDRARHETGLTFGSFNATGGVSR